MPKCLKKYRNKNKAVAYRTRSKDRYYKKHEYGVGNKRRYTALELSLIKKHSIPDVELARTIQRSLKAIHVMRVKLKNRKL